MRELLFHSAKSSMASRLSSHGGVVVFLSIASCMLICEGDLGDSNLSTMGSSILDEILSQTLPTDSEFDVIVLDPLSSNRSRLPQDFDPNQPNPEVDTINGPTPDMISIELNEPSGLNTNPTKEHDDNIGLLYTGDQDYNASYPFTSEPTVFDTEHIDNSTSELPTRAIVTRSSNEPKGSNFTRPKLPKLYIGGLFELNDTKVAVNGRSELDAALLAVQHINDKGFIPGYHLEMVYNDTKVGTIFIYHLCCPVWKHSCVTHKKSAL